LAQRLSDGEQQRRVVEDVFSQAADIAERRNSLEIVREMEEVERVRRVLESQDLGAGFERRKSIEIAVHAEEGERLRRVHEHELVLMEEDKQRELDVDIVSGLAEQERSRRLNEGLSDEVSEAWTSMNEELQSDWGKKKAIKKCDKEKARRIGENVAVDAASAAERKISQRRASREMENEQAIRIGEEQQARNMDEVWRSVSQKESLNAQDSERVRRMGAQVFGDASALATRKQSIKGVEEAVEIERARRLSLKNEGQ